MWQLRCLTVFWYIKYKSINGVLARLHESVLVYYRIMLIKMTSPEFGAILRAVFGNRQRVMG